jgi:hypothetical protein
MKDGFTCMSFSVSFLPDTGNRYFLGACDDRIRIYDFETCELLQDSLPLYGYYCDCVKVIRPIDIELEAGTLDYEESGAARKSKSNKKFKQDDNTPKEEQFINEAYIITRGVEMCDLEDGSLRKFLLLSFL